MFNTSPDSKFQSIGKDRTENMQTQVRLLLMEQSDQGLHCLPFHLSLLGGVLHYKSVCFTTTTAMVII